MRSWYISMGDNHAGLRNGMIAPGTVLDWGNRDGEKECLLSGWSDFIWHDVWMPGLEHVKTMTGTDPVYLLHSGDVTHGSRHIRDDNLYSPHITHQVEIAKQSLKPVREIPGFAGFYIVAGTGSHDYGGSSASLAVRDVFAQWGFPVYHADHLHASFDGFRIDLAHHGSYVSKLDHLRMNGARRDVEQLMKRDREWSRPSAHYYQRGHVHMPGHVTAQITWQNVEYSAEVIITPPMTGPNMYARQATRSMQEVRVGFYLTVVDHDTQKIDVYPWIKNRDTRDFIQVEVQLPYHKRGKKKKKKGKKK